MSIRNPKSGESEKAFTEAVWTDPDVVQMFPNPDARKAHLANHYAENAETGAKQAKKRKPTALSTKTAIVDSGENAAPLTGDSDASEEEQT